MGRAERRSRTSAPGSAPGRAAAALGVALLFASLVLLLLPVVAPDARAATTPVTGAVRGPATVAYGGRGDYNITAAGGPAEAPNGTVVGTYTYNVTLTGTNTTNASVSPSTGVLVNQSVRVTFIAPANLTETITLVVAITSGYHGQNETTNVTYAVAIVQPYLLSATLVAGKSNGLLPFSIAVLLDGAVVGNISVPALTASQSYALSFTYATQGLSPGWHTFSLSLQSEHGLVTFAGGSETFSESFYVAGSAPDYTVWYLAGAAAFIGASFIFLTRVAARRRGRARK